MHLAEVRLGAFVHKVQPDEDSNRHILEAFLDQLDPSCLAQSRTAVAADYELLSLGDSWLFSLMCLIGLSSGAICQEHLKPHRQ